MTLLRNFSRRACSTVCVPLFTPHHARQSFSKYVDRLIYIDVMVVILDMMWNNDDSALGVNFRMRDFLWVVS
jgi:hypothetical protein